MPRTQEERLAEKTIERQFLYELETDFELAPGTSRAVLETAQQVLLLSSENEEVGKLRPERGALVPFQAGFFYPPISALRVAFLPDRAHRTP